VNDELGDKQPVSTIMFTEVPYEKKYGSYSIYAVDEFLKNVATN
jgi:hypothetical protein